MARDLEAAYATAGYVLLQVILPPQQLINGARLNLVMVDGFSERIEIKDVPEQILNRIMTLVRPLTGRCSLTTQVLLTGREASFHRDDGLLRQSHCFICHGTSGSEANLMTSPTALVSLATSVPPFEFKQKKVEEVSRQIFGNRFPEFERLSRVFENTGVIKRYGVKPIEWYFEPRGWPERTQAFLDGGEELFIDVAQKAIERAGLVPNEIDTVVTVCSTGIATPSLEARVAGKIGFRSDIFRVPVFGLGCAGGVSGLSIASRLAQARPGTNVLLVAIELCTLAFRRDELTKANIVATSLFGDGAAAVVLRAGDAGAVQVEGAGEHLWPDTLDIMGWKVDPEGFGVIFRRSIPAFAAANMNAAVIGILKRMNLTRDDVDRFVCHPGGTKVVSALEYAFSLNQGSLDHERQILADYGNMSAPTVLFVLERVLAGQVPFRSLLTSLGPGFTASCVAVRRAA
ncbi:alkylresorcinol/alkylpyrone synthase [Nitrobacteraceae bacterium AZCC 2161]